MGKTECLRKASFLEIFVVREHHAQNKSRIEKIRWKPVDGIDSLTPKLKNKGPLFIEAEPSVNLPILTPLMRELKKLPTELSTPGVLAQSVMPERLNCSQVNDSSAQKKMRKRKGV